MAGKRGIAQRKPKGDTKRTAGRTSYNSDRKNVHKTAQGVAGMDLDDNDKDNQQQSIEAGSSDGGSKLTTPIPDINTVPVTLFIRADSTTVTDPNAKPLQLLDIPIVHTTLHHVETYAKLFTLIDDHPTINTTLSNLYRLDLSDHKEAYLSFTSEHGTRHTARLSKYLFPDPLNTGDDVPGSLVTHWKSQIAAGTLEHNPWCNCARHEDVPSGRAKHGVEVVEVLKSDRVAARCRELCGLVEDLQEKEKGYKIERLSCVLAEKAALLEAHGIVEEDESDEDEDSEYEDE